MNALMNLSLTQFTAWIIMMVLLIIPLIAFLFTWMTNIWFTKKTEYTVDILKRIVNVIDAAKREWFDKKKEENKDEQEQ